MPLIKVDFENFVFRSHYFGELMGKAQGKSNMEIYQETLARYEEKQRRYASLANTATKTADKLLEECGDLDDKLVKLHRNKDIPILSDTCKSRLIQIYTEETTGRKKQIQSKYFEKGTLTEEDSITYYSLRTGTMHRKNKVEANNGYVKGSLDFESDDVVVDTKGSWDIFTFDATVAKAINPVYHWQLDCYMWLWNKKKGHLAYCLHNTPDYLIAKEEKYLIQQFVGREEEFKIAHKEMMQRMTYDDITQLERKIRIYEVERSEERIELAKATIPHLRNYLTNIQEKDYEITCY